MTLVLDISIQRAQGRLEKAIAIARSPSPLPPRWIQFAETVGASPRKIDITVLGCALIAKSCNKAVDPLVVKPGISARGYNMRSIAEKVLLPVREEHQLDIGSTSSANPVNSSTWLKYQTLAEVRVRHQPSYDYLIEVLREVDSLDEAAALMALAAWARLRMAVTAAKRSVRVRTTDADLTLLLSACRTFVLENAEMGARGQALVAAALGLIWKDVRTGKVTDPSRRWPGDVHAFQPEAPIPLMAAEVKQRPVAEGEVRNFIAECIAKGIDNVFYVVLHDKSQVDMSNVRPLEVAVNNECLFTWFDDVDDFVLAALSWSPQDTSTAVKCLVRDMSERLEQVQLSSDSQLRWAEITRSKTTG